MRDNETKGKPQKCCHAEIVTAMSLFDDELIKGK